MGSPFKQKIVIISVCLLLVTPMVAAGDLVINEVMSSNASTITDEDGDYTDWLELYNSGNLSINLSNYGLSDDKTEPFKWTFSDAFIQAKQHLLIFASDKDRRVQDSYWETIINQGDIWKYRIGSPDIPSDWNTVGFQDAGWSSGVSGFGYSDGDDATELPGGTMSIYIRKVFTVNNLDEVLQVILHVDFDDGFVAYLNGEEIARANVSGNPPAYNQEASSHEAEMYNGGLPEMFTNDTYKSFLREGDNVLAIQGHNVSTSSSDLSLIPFLTLGLNMLPADPRGTPDFMKFDKPMLHTNFKISAGGETLVLTDPDGILIDKTVVPALTADISWGRNPDGGSDWNMSENPTPGESNDGSGAIEWATAPQFSDPGGFYSRSIVLTLANEAETGTIHYTLDSSEPTTSSPVYGSPIAINETKVVKARIFAPGLLPGKTITQTYFLGTDHSLPVFSLSTDPYNLFDIDYGIYMLGTSYNTDSPQYGANFWEDWERPIHIEFFEPDGSRGFSMDAGIKIIGGWSRANPQKSFSIFARSVYGYSSIKYHLFPDRPFDEYEAFILRDGGNDWPYTHFAEGFAHRLVENIDMENSAFRPCVVYVNGEYWGILNLREKQNEHYLAMYYDVDPDNVDMLEWDRSVINGDAQHYNHLYNFIENNDLQNSTNYEYVKTQMDIDNFIDYMVTEIYLDNRDWPGNNIKYWRPKTENGKWRWLLYDTDFGFGIYDGYSAGYNTLEFALEPNGPSWPNPPWSTLFLRKLVQNDEFRAAFINRFADYFNTIFSPATATAKINEIVQLIESEMPAHVNKWSQPHPDWAVSSLWWNNIENWYNNIQGLRNFVNIRVEYLRQYISIQFGLPGTATITLNISPAGSGNVNVSTLFIKDYPWQGIYFRETPIQITALPYDNFKFSHWEGLSTSNAASISISLERNENLVAVFEPVTDIRQSVVINEINYNSHPDYNSEDWVELYNNGAPANLAWWQMKDANDSFYFPNNIMLGHSEFLVVCRDTAAFKTIYSDVHNCIGNFQFKLNRTGETIQICDNLGSVIDSVKYANRFPWPIMPDGGGSTLELKNPNMNNSLSYAWMASESRGTPGRANDNLVTPVADTDRSLIESFRLFPNYPNPFNASTTIHFEVAEMSQVNVSVYNLRGQLVEVILNDQVSPGYHQIKWDAGHLSTGLYLYKISAGDHFVTAKCLLIK